MVQSIGTKFRLSLATSRIFAGEARSRNGEAGAGGGAPYYGGGCCPGKAPTTLPRPYRPSMPVMAQRARYREPEFPHEITSSPSQGTRTLFSTRTLSDLPSSTLTEPLVIFTRGLKEEGEHVRPRASADGTHAIRGSRSKISPNLLSYPDIQPFSTDPHAGNDSTSAVPRPRKPVTPPVWQTPPISQSLRHPRFPSSPPRSPPPGSQGFIQKGNAVKPFGSPDQGLRLPAYLTIA
ncbi:hypothetical protein DFH27DRAFT_527528 [Peziza echinospora]|nr:hypothetical protein DFH27DRAFT_527528 [Peziza echinospora]